MSILDRIATVDRLHVQQKFRPLVNVYTVSTVAPDGASAGEPLVQVQQKRMAIKEQINFTSATDENEPLLRLQAKNVMDVSGLTEVQLANGQVIGQMRKVFGASLLRSTWELLDDGGTVRARVQESSVPIAVIRRLWGFIPVVSSIPFPLPFHFDIDIDGQTVGTYKRMMSLRDSYVLDLSGDPQRRIDRRVAMALAVALDALQAR